MNREMPPEQHPRSALAPALALLMALVSSSPAHAQIDVLSPAFRDLNGGVVWGSLGTAIGSDARIDDRPVWRGGFAAFYGPFGGPGDTTIVFTRTVADSTDTTLVDTAERPGRRTHRRERSTTVYRTETRRAGPPGKVMLAIGYEHSSFYHFGADPLPRTLAMGGLFLGGFVGPYRVPGPWRRLVWYGGFGGTVSQLEDIAVRVDTLQLRFKTERTLAPELFLLLGYPVASNYRILGAVSYQYVRFGSLEYRPVESSRLLPGEVLRSLPTTLRLESLHWTLGLSFSASSLLARR